MKENTKNKKRKESKNTLAKYLSTRIVLATIIGIIVYIIIYLFFFLYALAAGHYFLLSPKK